LNNKRLNDRLIKIKNKENQYIKPLPKNFYEQHKKMYDNIQRKLYQENIIFEISD